jgi:hypothetical protein
MSRFIHLQRSDFAKLKKRGVILPYFGKESGGYFSQEQKKEGYVGIF